MQIVIEPAFRKKQRFSPALCALLGGMVLAGAALAAPGRTTYHVTNLGAGAAVGGTYINASGQVAYSLEFDLGSPVRSWFYDGATARDIGTLGGRSARATGLTDDGQITGQSVDRTDQVRAFIWNRRAGMADLGVLDGTNETWEPAINNKGVVAGYATTEGSGYVRAFRWTAAAGMEDIGALSNASDRTAQATAINDAGLIAGNSATLANDYHSFAWTRSGGMMDIDTLGSRYSAPVAVGAKGLVGGNVFLPGGHAHAYAWTRATGMRDLGAAGRDDSWTVGMSASGRIVGVVTSDGAYQQAMTWTAESGMLDLGTLGGHASAALAANSKGQVVGGAVTKSDEYHAFLWTAADGMIDLNRRLHHPPAGLVLNAASAISDKGWIVAASNAGLVLLTPVCGCSHTHTVGPIAAPGVVKPGTLVEAAVSFAGGKPGAAYHVFWSWGDGSGETAGNAGNGSARGSHTYAQAGIYTVTARVSDLAGNSVAVSRKIVSADSGGAEGAFVSPHMARQPGPFQGGVARFAFLAPAA
ncbi:MAG TPA: PKD domain-containing protein, partial [Telluria sp.]|nr:PKD domain-containing protein [Telluria sp.]